MVTNHGWFLLFQSEAHTMLQNEHRGFRRLVHQLRVDVSRLLSALILKDRKSDHIYSPVPDDVTVYPVINLTIPPELQEYLKILFHEFVSRHPSFEVAWDFQAFFSAGEETAVVGILLLWPAGELDVPDLPALYLQARPLDNELHEHWELVGDAWLGNIEPPGSVIA